MLSHSFCTKITRRRSKPTWLCTLHNDCCLPLLLSARLNMCEWEYVIVHQGQSQRFDVVDDMNLWKFLWKGFLRTTWCSHMIILYAQNLHLLKIRWHITHNMHLLQMGEVTYAWVTWEKLLTSLLSPFPPKKLSWPPLLKCQKQLWECTWISFISFIGGRYMVSFYPNCSIAITILNWHN